MAKSCKMKLDGLDEMVKHSVDAKLNTSTWQVRSTMIGSVGM